MCICRDVCMYVYMILFPHFTYKEKTMIIRSSKIINQGHHAWYFRIDLYTFLPDIEIPELTNYTCT